MQEGTKTRKIWKKIPFAIVGILLVFISMLLLLIFNQANSMQSMPAFYPRVYFVGQYKVGDGPWQEVQEDRHIPATKGDVTLQGQFHMVAPDGEYIGIAGEETPLAFYLNHIQLTVRETGQEAYTFDMEHPMAGEGMCGENCMGYTLMSAEPVTLNFHNPHKIGNDRAIDLFLEELSVYGGLSYEKEFMNKGDLERNAGLVFAITAFALLGTALFSALLHTPGSGRLFLISLCMFFAGGYFVYGAQGIFYWSDSIIGNTTILCTCMMLYMLCMCALIASSFEKKVRKIGIGAVVFLGAACIALAAICIVTDLRIYDALLWWLIVQSAVNAVLLACVLLGGWSTTKGKNIINISAIVLLLGFETDIVGTALGWWQGGVICKYIFVVLFAIAIVLVWQIIPRNINAARKTEEMEAEQKAIRAQLQENRVAIMISQIQPHFIYNTLGTIQYLCRENPEQAAKLVQNFSLYLRGNFSELDNTMPIRVSKELEHVRYYTEIELTRFPDMAVHYDIQTDAFYLPALTVQPLVENAIKHGLMGREEGGTVTVTVFETETHYCVKVTDDGVGFDVNEPQDARKHVGIRNVQERLQMMCGGSLVVESQKGKGTTALIQIPKEGKKA